MPIFRLPAEHYFPPPSLAESNGLLAVGGDLHPQRLLLAYRSGIFPWYSEGQPILWFSPDPRYVLKPSQIHVGRSLKKRIRREDYRITMDTAFEQVISHCSSVKRPMQFGTWITEDMRKAYVQLHQLGYAHSVEAWAEGELVGGLYGVLIGDLFAGESMFAHRSDASKVAFVWMVKQLEIWGVELIDCQVYTEHLQRFGAKNVSRAAYLERIHPIVQAYRPPKKWKVDGRSRSLLSLFHTDKDS